MPSCGRHAMLSCIVNHETAGVTAALGYHALKHVWNDGNPHGPGAGPDVFHDSSTSSDAWGGRDGLRPQALTSLIIDSTSLQ